MVRRLQRVGAEVSARADLASFDAAMRDLYELAEELSLRVNPWMEMMKR